MTHRTLWPAEQERRRPGPTVAEWKGTARVVGWTPAPRFVDRWRALLVVARWRVALVVAALWIASGCAAPSEADPEGWQAAVSDSVRTVFMSCVEEEMRGNPDVCLGQMSRDPDFRYFVNTTLSTNADSITARTRRGFAQRAVWEMEVTIDTVAALAPDAAVVTATLRVTTQDVGGPVLTRPASWSLVYARRDGRWQIVQGHWTYGDPVE